MTTSHMVKFITKCMSNTLSTMAILQRRGHAKTNLWPRYGLDPKTIQHLYQCTHEGRSGIWTASVDTLSKWLEAWNTDSEIAIILVDTLLCISRERNDLPQCPNLTLHSDILRIGWLSIILGFIPTSLTHTQQTYLTHIIIKRMGLKWASQLITKTWKLLYGQWLHHSKLKNTGYVLYNHIKELILNTKIID